MSTESTTKPENLGSEPHEIPAFTDEMDFYDYVEALKAHGFVVQQDSFQTRAQDGGIEVKWAVLVTDPAQYARFIDETNRGRMEHWERTKKISPVYADIKPKILTTAERLIYPDFADNPLTRLDRYAPIALRNAAQAYSEAQATQG